MTHALWTGSDNESLARGTLKPWCGRFLPSFVQNRSGPFFSNLAHGLSTAVGQTVPFLHARKFFSSVVNRVRITTEIGELCARLTLQIQQDKLSVLFDRCWRPTCCIN